MNSPANLTLFTGIRWVARIISLILGLSLVPFSGQMWGASLLLIAGIAWRWPLVGGTLSVLVAGYMLAVLVVNSPDLDPLIAFPFFIALLLSGLFHLVAAWWGRRAAFRGVAT